MKAFLDIESKIAMAGLLLGLVWRTSTGAAVFDVPAEYPTVQAAVNAAGSNDTIRIASGVYTNQVQIISKKLTLIGQPGTILRATEQMTPIFLVNGWHVPVMFVQLSDVTVQGLTFEGERLADRFVGSSVGDLVGLHFFRSSGDVENCAFYGFRESAPGSEWASCLWFQTFEDDNVNARVVGCTFADNYEGIYVKGSPTRQSVHLTIENNTIVGLGPMSNDLNYAGIFIREGVGGQIAGNTISGFSYVGTKADFPISFGLLAANETAWPAFGILQHLEIERNILRDNQMHIALIKGDGSVVRNNRLQGTAPGIIPVGLAVTGTNVTIANNQFEDMEEGIRLLGNDPNWGSTLGIALDAQVTSNRFCNVTTHINVEPLATATEATTLTCPFPLPTLGIAPAVLLTWPDDGETHALESAPDPQGPWSPLNATPTVQDGQVTFAVKTDQGHRFFRLH